MLYMKPCKIDSHNDSNDWNLRWKNTLAILPKAEDGSLKVFDTGIKYLKCLKSPRSLPLSPLPEKLLPGCAFWTSRSAVVLVIFPTRELCVEEAKKRLQDCLVWRNHALW